VCLNFHVRDRKFQACVPERRVIFLNVEAKKSLSKSLVL